MYQDILELHAIFKHCWWSTLLLDQDLAPSAKTGAQSQSCAAVISACVRPNNAQALDCLDNLHCPARLTAEWLMSRGPQNSPERWERWRPDWHIHQGIFAGCARLRRNSKTPVGLWTFKCCSAAALCRSAPDASRRMAHCSAHRTC